jgi:DNA-binding transcriptional MerR regulator
VRISELARTAGLPVATVKYYLRDGLLPPGRATSATQAEYDETHVRRLRLVRALAEIGGLALSDVREVLAALDAPGFAAIGRAHSSLPPAAPEGTGTARATALMAELGWRVDPRSTALTRLEAALEALEAVGQDPAPGKLARYAQAALDVASLDIDSTPTGSQAEVVEYVVVGTVLYEPILVSLRRLAQQHLFINRRPDG